MEDVGRTFGERTALAGLNLRVMEGQTVAVMGPSGCGKSTALRTIIRLVEPDRGEITWRGTSILRLSQRELAAFRRRVGFVFQRSNLIGRLNVLENVMFPEVMAGVPVSRARRHAMAALGGVGMDGRADARVRELSGGEMQRVAIARAIAGSPELILWDEPTASLDPILVVEVLQLIEDLIHRLGTTMLIVTHEVTFARRCADRVVLMDRGRVVEEGPPGAVLARPRSSLGKRYAAFLAYPGGLRQENASGL
ncbi:MAG: ATP-binding cassette domain-containing protein [Firmicutes bacterium]|jgi:polar amino acid transport system ATP-binding protein|nr:ATP-binding cassette domain-containing protein [Bacillota bacterium]